MHQEPHKDGEASQAYDTLRRKVDQLIAQSRQSSLDNDIGPEGIAYAYYLPALRLAEEAAKNFPDSVPIQKLENKLKTQYDQMRQESQSMITAMQAASFEQLITALTELQETNPNARVPIHDASNQYSHMGSPNEAIERLIQRAYEAVSEGLLPQARKHIEDNNLEAALGVMQVIVSYRYLKLETLLEVYHFLKEVIQPPIKAFLADNPRHDSIQIKYDWVENELSKALKDADFAPQQLQVDHSGGVRHILSTRGDLMARISDEQAAYPTVFISYAHADGRDFAEKFEADLRGHQINTWWDDGIPPGAAWEKVIWQALDQSNALVLILTEAAVESPYVEAEWHYAFDERKILVVPILAPDFDQRKIPLVLRARQYVDARKQYQPALQRVVETLHSLKL